MKKLILFTLALFAFNAFSQLKVDQYGRIGMGTNWPNPGYRCHIRGDLLLTTYPAIPSIELRMKVGNGAPGAEIGTTVDKIAMWASETSYNKLYAERYLTVSDSTMKVDIKPLTNSLENLLKLKTYSYKLREAPGSDKISERREYGFLSQEVEQLFPALQITDDLKDIKLMDYNQIIPLTVTAIQEQQIIIYNLQKKIELLESRISSVNSADMISSSNVLYQNTPNPFNEKTSIRYSIEKTNFRNASILIFDMNGVLLNQNTINSAGEGSIEINGQQLKPGMYIYTLLVNEKEIDSKRMILLN